MAHKQNPLTTDEFRIAHSKIIEEFQWLEWTLKNMYAKLIEGHYPECFDEVSEKPLGELIKKLKDVEKINKTHYLTSKDYNNLKKVKDMRNYWCHNCYVEGIFIKRQPNGRIVSKSSGLLERVKNDYEIVRELAKKLVEIRIPVRAEKWKLTDFCKIIGVTCFDINGNKIFELKN